MECQLDQDMVTRKIPGITGIQGTQHGLQTVMSERQAKGHTMKILDGNSKIDSFPLALGNSHWSRSYTQDTKDEGMDYIMRKEMKVTARIQI